MECGHLPEEIEHALAGKHTYAEVRIFGDLSVVLCDFCQVDFGSHDPTFFGLSRHDKGKLGYQKMQFLREVDNIYIGQDKYCPACNLRLAFLKFVKAARDLHTKTKKTGCSHSSGDG
jgi:hypothetical protein